MKKESASVRFLYGTAVGRFFLKGLTRPWISKLVGAFLSAGISRFMVPRFIKKHQIDVSAFGEQKFHSFNEFFSRRRTQQIDVDDKCLISPCDAHLSIYRIGETRSFEIKHTTYTLESLLGDAEAATRFQDGYCLIFRLTPQHYHRYCYACSGRLVSKKRIEGRLHCVRPFAYTRVPVFTENSREYVLIESLLGGMVAQMEIGALLVGRICNHDSKEAATQGEEKGYFEFGGSTIVLLTQADRLQLADRFADAVQTDCEMDVVLGEKVGTFMVGDGALPTNV